VQTCLGAAGIPSMGYDIPSAVAPDNIHEGATQEVLYSDLAALAPLSHHTFTGNRRSLQQSISLMIDTYDPTCTIVDVEQGSMAPYWHNILVLEDISYTGKFISKVVATRMELESLIVTLLASKGYTILSVHQLTPLTCVQKRLHYAITAERALGGRMNPSLAQTRTFTYPTSFPFLVDTSRNHLDVMLSDLTRGRHHVGRNIQETLSDLRSMVKLDSKADRHKQFSNEHIGTLRSMAILEMLLEFLKMKVRNKENLGSLIQAVFRKKKHIMLLGNGAKVHVWAETIRHDLVEKLPIVAGAFVMAGEKSHEERGRVLSEAEIYGLFDT
jgi:hypothetical protein